jgi:hypothetical protein
MRKSPNVVEMAHVLVSQQPHFCGRISNFDFQFKDKVLIVRGKVPTFFLKQTLQHALSRLEGIERIDNQVEVIYGYKLNTVILSSE